MDTDNTPTSPGGDAPAAAAATPLPGAIVLYNHRGTWVPAIVVRAWFDTFAGADIERAELWVFHGSQSEGFLPHVEHTTATPGRVHGCYLGA